jgi:hypothetical protein
MIQIIRPAQSYLKKQKNNLTWPEFTSQVYDFGYKTETSL